MYHIRNLPNTRICRHLASHRCSRYHLVLFSGALQHLMRPLSMRCPAKDGGLAAVGQDVPPVWTESLHHERKPIAKGQVLLRSLRLVHVYALLVRYHQCGVLTMRYLDALCVLWPAAQPFQLTASKAVWCIIGHLACRTVLSADGL